MCLCFPDGDASVEVATVALHSLSFCRATLHCSWAAYLAWLVVVTHQTLDTTFHYGVAMVKLQMNELRPGQGKWNIAHVFGAYVHYHTVPKADNESDFNMVCGLVVTGKK